MLSIALKNTILVVLITLILHFLILNYINDVKGTKPKRSTSNQNSVDQEIPNLKMEPFEGQGLITTNSVPVPAGTPIEDYNKKKEDVEKLNEELLYNYVFTPNCAKPKEEAGKESSENSLKLSHAPSECKQRGLDGALLIGEYDNESALNGGNLQLIDGVSAFDTQAAYYYQEY